MHGGGGAQRGPAGGGRPGARSRAPPETAMSTGFRFFLLILFGFGAIFAYRFRSVELHRWLRAQPVEAGELDARLRIASPVDRVLDANVSWAWLLGSMRAAEPRPPAEILEPSPDESAATTSPELELEAADLAVSEDLAAGEGTPAAEMDGAAGETPAPPGPEAPAPAPPPDVLSGSIERVYKVEAGDSLWKIAARQLGSGKRYREILEWNRELFQRVNPDVIPPGTELRLRAPARQENL